MVLKSVTDYVGLLFFLVVVVGTLIPVIKVVAKFRKWTLRLQSEQIDPINSSSSDGGRVSLRSECFGELQNYQVNMLNYRWRVRMARSQRSEVASTMELLHLTESKLGEK